MINRLNNLTNKQIILYGSLFIFLISGIPYFLLGENTIVNTHDNLDGEFVNYVMLKNEGMLFNFNSSQIFPNLLGGIPLGTFHSEFSFIRFLFLVLPPFWAYVINLLLIRVIGFAGMYLLLEKYILKSDKKLQSAMIAMIFAFIPIYPMYGLSVLGQPLVIWIFLNIRNAYRLRLSFLLLVLYPFYSHLALVAIFLLFELFVLEIHLSRYKIFKLNKRAFFSLVVLTLAFVLANWLTLSGFLSKSFIGHRTAYIPSSTTVDEAIAQAKYTFYNGQYHSGNFNFMLIYIVAVASILFQWKDWSNKKNIILLVLVIAAISIFEGFYPNLKYSFKDSFHFLSEFEFCRFTFLLPTLIFMVYAFSIRSFSQQNLLITSVFSIIIFSSMVLSNSEFYENWKLVFNKEARKHDISYDAFFAKDQFSQIKSDLSLNNDIDRVVCLGFFPSVAQYNGFYTLDGYENNYPLSYKQEFRKVMSKELDKNEKLKKYFDNWGSRCYLFSSETFGICTANCSKEKKMIIKNLDVNTEQLKKMNCRYILSSVEVSNASHINLRLQKVYNDSNSIWQIFVYRII